jgi:hypothetical protein
MVNKVEKSYLSRCASDLICNGLTIVEVVTPNPGCVDDGDYVNIGGFVRIEAKYMAVLESDGLGRAGCCGCHAALA